MGFCKFAVNSFLDHAVPDKPALLYAVPWSRSLLYKLTVPQLVNKFPELYGIESTITMFITKATFLSQA
jgi:hypothetical protein